MFRTRGIQQWLSCVVLGWFCIMMMRSEYCSAFTSHLPNQKTSQQWNPSIQLGKRRRRITSKPFESHYRIGDIRQSPWRTTKTTLSISNGEATTKSLNNNNTLHEVDLRQHSSFMLKYDALQDRYVYDSASSNNGNDNNGQTTNKSKMMINNHRFIGIIPKPIVRLLRLAFLPEGVTLSYYRYMKYRILQRYISSVVHVLGTQSLLLGLGFRGNRQLGVSAAMYWVLKDALGKIVRMVWASKMGGKFDSDAKRWRFRASLLFALGNGLEVATYIAPQWFLLLATLGNAAKQIGMLTSSATRNALYTTFKTANTKTENIGDITAKGEAQIAVVDLVGIGSGVLLSSKYLHFHYSIHR